MVNVCKIDLYNILDVYWESLVIRFVFDHFYGIFQTELGSKTWENIMLCNMFAGPTVDERELQST
jgi:hypothetical protein